MVILSAIDPYVEKNITDIENLSISATRLRRIILATSHPDFDHDFLVPIKDNRHQLVLTVPKK